MVYGLISSDACYRLTLQPAVPESESHTRKRTLIANILAIAIGGAMGALLRYGTALWVVRYSEGALPLATWIVNLTGCLLIGLCVPLFAQTALPGQVRLFVVVGFLGSLTTFSTYSLETVILWQDGSGLLALGNAIGSVVLGVVFVWLGIQLGRMIGAG